MIPPLGPPPPPPPLSTYTQPASAAALPHPPTLCLRPTWALPWAVAWMRPARWQTWCFSETACRRSVCRAGRWGPGQGETHLLRKGGGDLHGMACMAARVLDVLQLGRTPRLSSPLTPGPALRPILTPALELQGLNQTAPDPLFPPSTFLASPPPSLSSLHTFRVRTPHRCWTCCS